MFTSVRFPSSCKINFLTNNCHKCDLCGCCSWFFSWIPFTSITKRPSEHFVLVCLMKIESHSYGSTFCCWRHSSPTIGDFRTLLRVCRLLILGKWLQFCGPGSCCSTAGRRHFYWVYCWIFLEQGLRRIVSPKQKYDRECDQVHVGLNDDPVVKVA